MNFQNAPIQYQSRNLRKGPHSGHMHYSADINSEATSETTEFDIFKVFHITSKYRQFIIILLVFGVIVGLLYNLFQPVQFLAQTKIEIGTFQTNFIEDLEPSRPVNDVRAFETARQKILTRDLAHDVAIKLGLANNERFAGFYGVRSNEEVSDARATSLIQNNLAVTILRNTNILQISFAHSDKEVAAAVVNAVAETFIDQSINSNSEASKNTHVFLTNQAALAKEKLRLSEQALLNYAKSEDITITDNENSLVSKSISDMNAALSKAVRERLSAERFVSQVKAGNAKALPEVFDSRPIQITKQRIAELRSNYQEKLSTLKPGFPEMKRLRNQIQELEKQVGLEIDTIASAMQIRLEQAITNETALRNELAGLAKDQADFHDKNIQYLILKREVDSNRGQYETLIDKLNDIDVSAQLEISNATIIEKALPPDQPIAPNLHLNLLVSIVIFGMLAAISVTLLELSDNRFSSAEHIEAELQIPTLTRIPIGIQQDLRDEIEDITSSVSEAYRSLRTSLLFTAPDIPVNSIAVTSSSMADGKTTTCYKLACDFAALGKSILVIDADLRKPGLHTFFDVPNHVGLSNLLGNVMDSQNVLKLFQKTDHPNVTILTAGDVPPNPADLLASEKMALTLHYATKKFDLVIIDCPPVLGLSDAPIVSHLAGATLLVISQQSAFKKVASNAVAQLRAVGANLVGTVVTRCDDQTLKASYAYGYASNGFIRPEMKNNKYLLEGDEPAFDWETHKKELTSPPYERTVL